MQYCTLQDLVDRFGETEILQLTDRAHRDRIDEEVLDRAIEDAGGEIDGYITAAGYLPASLDPVPRILVAYACDITRYRLYDNAATDQVTRRYDDAIKFLRALAKGDVRLDAREPEPGVGAATFEGGRQVFNGGGF